MKKAKYPRPSGFSILSLDTETTGVSVADIPVGASYALGEKDDGPVGYNAWGHQGGGNNDSKEKVVEWLRGLTPDHTVVFHNALFDLRMIASTGVDLISQGCKIEDTQFMAALLNELEPSFSLGPLGAKYLAHGKSDEALNEYCAKHFGGPPTRGGQTKNYWRAPAPIVEEYAEDDAFLTRGLRRHFRPLISKFNLEEVYKLELDLIPILFRMYQHGVSFNEEAALSLAGRLKGELEDMETEWAKLTGGIPLSGEGSQKLFHEWWINSGLPIKRHPPTAKMIESDRTEGNLALGADVLEKIDHPVPNLKLDIDKRLKALGFLEGDKGLLTLAHEGKIHTSLHPLKSEKYGTVSGRFSSSDPNLQNQFSPDRDDVKEKPEEEWWGHIFRSLFPALPGRDWVKIDYSGIELRVLAHYAGGEILDGYLSDPHWDLHGFAAHEVFGVTPEDDDWDEKRARSKNGSFALLYGAGVGRVAVTLGVGRAEAEAFMTKYLQVVPSVAKLNANAKYRAARRGWIRTHSGRVRRLPLDGGRFQRTHMALNALIQGTAADIMKMAMVAVAPLLDWEENVLHLTIHDELDFSLSKDPRLLKQIAEAMVDLPMFRPPFLVEPSIGPTWGDLTKIKDLDSL